MAQAAFVLTAFLVGAFFVRRKKVDPLAVAFGSSVIYFIPGFFGVARFSYGEGLGEFSAPFVPGTYGVMSIVLAALVAGAAAIDRIAHPVGWDVNFQSRVPAVLFGFAAVATAVSVSHTGTYFLCLDKSITLQRIDAWYSYASISAPFLVATAYALRQRALTLIGCVFLVADIYAGFRLSTAITFLAIVMLSGDRLFQGRKSASSFILAVVLAGASLFVVKQLIAPAKYATSGYCEAPSIVGPITEPSTEKQAPSQIMETPEPIKQYLIGSAVNLTRPRFYFSAFVSQAEPFVIQSMLNEVVRKGFQTDSDYLKGQLLVGLPFGASIFGIDSSSVTTFNSRAQTILFPEAHFGMANNPWGQAYAAGGLWMVVVFASVYAFILGGLTIIFRRTEGTIKAGIAVIGVWIGFYFHRNDLFIEILYVKTAVYIFLLALFMGWAFSLLQRVNWFRTNHALKGRRP